MRSPALFPIVAVHSYAALAGLAIVAALAMPSVGMTVTADGAGVRIVVAGGRDVAVPARASVSIRAAGEAIAQDAGELVADWSPRGSPATVAAWFDTRSRLAALIRRPGARATIAGGGTFVLAPRPRRLAALPRDTWLLLAQGALMTLIGSWIVGVRTTDLRARLFALSCAGMAAASLSGALYDARELAADGRLLHATQIVNFASSYLGSAALAAVFAVGPRALASPRMVLAAVAAATAWGAAAGVGWLPLIAFYLGLLVLVGGFVGLLLIQFARSRGDPAARAELRWIGVTTLVGAGQISICMAAPHLLGIPEIGGDGATIIPLAIVYGGIAFGIGPHRLFDLDRWTYRVFTAAGATLGLLLLDAALVAMFDLDRPAAFVLALAAAGTLYLPARAMIWRRLVGAEHLRDEEKFQLATRVAFAPTPQARRDGWRSLIARLFDPLSIEAAAEPVAAVTLLEGGAALAIPAVADGTALRVAFRARGTRLFGREQLRLAEEMVGLMRRADATRAEYARGVDEERQRIARDLHDDVCATLLTSLHRDDVATVRSDVRTAMADIRTMVGGLSGERVTLDRALATLRFETAERLGAAGVALRWPVPDEDYPAIVLDYAFSRALFSTAREAVSNTLKHARASAVTVDVALERDRLCVRLADDGCVPWPANPGGHGIANMRGRMADVGGALLIETEPSPRAGTAVTLTLPLPQLLPACPLESGMGRSNPSG